ncbi:hypothetical protein GQ53DRAFT_723274 [Thozetella sp. PMI_491]|nr:hypothetical protein GQ53DRAFT_723274 [Thozetella sp. PMI_491]
MASPIGNLIHPDPQPRSSPYRTPAQQSLTLVSLPPSAHPTASPTSAQGLSRTLPSPSLSGTARLSSAPAPPTPIAGASATPQSAKGHSNTQSLYQCADCLRRYSRPEHLQRHIATHTLGKRFTCDVCTKAFSRADLLKRHRANHFDENGTKRRRINSSPGAGRVAHACVACSKARVKCEELKPCARCKNRGINCEYAASEDAAMHLLHLSANIRNVERRGSVASTESGYYQPPSTSGHRTQPYSQQDQQQQQPQPQQPPPPQRLYVQQQHRQPQPSPQQQQQQHPLALLPSQQPYPEPLGTPVIKTSPSQTDNAPLAEAQLPTPETLMEQSNADGFQPPYAANGMVDMAKLPFSDFLQGVLYEQSLGDSSRLVEAQGLAVLDFCDNANLDLNDIDFDLLDHWNIDNGMQAPTPNVPNLHTNTGDLIDITTMRSNLVKIWTQSPWRWSPSIEDNAYVEQSHLPLATRDVQGASMHEGGRKRDRVVKDQLNSSNRDKILAIVLSICRNDGMMKRVASSFPSAEVLDSWIHIFLAAHLCQVSSWIHYGSFSLNSQWPEWLASAASAGAASAPVPTLRRFGFALNEAVRLTIPSRFEENNTKITDIGLVQALILTQDVGLWSGNRRKMEIAECHIQIPNAMMRYRGKYQRSAYPVVVIDPSDEGEVLEQKWKKWCGLEGWKRLVYHAFMRDAQVSMTQFSNPTITYSELTLPLPYPKELWFARSAEEFKIRYLELGAAEGRRAPSVGDLLREITLLSTCHRKVDVQLSISIFLHAFWALIWEYRQLNSVLRAPAHAPTTQNSSTLLLNSRHQDLCKQLQDFQQLTADWHEMLSAQESTVLHLLLMNLNVSLDDLQLFSGKEGEDQARRVYPRLQTWSSSAQARQAVWSAGQIFRQAKFFPPGHLKDFYAIAVHHAALCLWTYGVISKAAVRSGGAARHPAYEVVPLDGEDGPHVSQYINYGAGRAVLRAPALRDGSAPPAESPLDDPRGCMEIAQEILRANFVGVHEGLPPINENSIHLLKQLGNAAWAVGLG